MGQATLTVTAKGRVTLRRAVLDHLGARPGDKLMLDLLPGRIEVRVAPGGDIGAFIGCLAREDQAVVSIADMNEATAAGWAGLP